MEKRFEVTKIAKTSKFGEDWATLYPTICLIRQSQAKDLEQSIEIE